jgi:large subunit ribosomal protein L6
MSKIAKIPVPIKEGALAVISNGTITVTGPKGSLSFVIPIGIEVKEEEGKLIVSQAEKNNKETNALFGLTRSLIFNMMEGVSTGYNKNLELSGVGYRAQASGDTLTLSLGFSHQVIVKGEQGITFSVAENVITVSGIDKALVGNTAAKIRAIRPPEPYKGKGIKYQGERIRRKVGKAAKAVGVK